MSEFDLLIDWTNSCLRTNSILIYFYVRLSDMDVYTSLEFRCIIDDWLEEILMSIYIHTQTHTHTHVCVCVCVCVCVGSVF